MIDLLPDLCDEHADKVKVLDAIFRDFGAEPLFWGQAVTVRCYEDNSRVRELVSQPGTGKVLVVDGGGLLRCALMGDLLAEKALENGWEGVVIHGAIRDAGTLGGLALGIKALAACPVRSEKRGEGVTEVPVTFAGVTIYPGDYVYSDANGVLVSREPLSHPQL